MASPLAAEILTRRRLPTLGPVSAYYLCQYWLPTPKILSFAVGVVNGRLCEGILGGRVAVARLLSVDDDPSILRIIGRIGTELGFNVECLSSSQRFMTTYVRVKPHVVTLDIMMPDIDGIELIRWLDDIESNASIIIISGGHSYYVQATAKLAEARGRLRTSILRKPFETSLLRNALLEAAQAARVPLSPMHQ